MSKKYNKMISSLYEFNKKQLNNELKIQENFIGYKNELISSQYNDKIDDLESLIANEQYYIAIVVLTAWVEKNVVDYQYINIMDFGTWSLERKANHIEDVQKALTTLSKPYYTEELRKALLTDLRHGQTEGKMITLQIIKQTNMPISIEYPEMMSILKPENIKTDSLMVLPYENIKRVFVFDNEIKEYLSNIESSIIFIRNNSITTKEELLKI